MNKTKLNTNEISATHALRMFEAGQHISCPICNTMLASIPTDTPPGAGRILGLTCPIDNKHFLIYGEDAETMKKARDGLQKIADKSK